MALGLVVFDLDGTLIDSQVDLCSSVNATLRHLGKPELPQAVISSYIGDGASMLVRRALGDPEDGESILAEALAFFLAYYQEHKLDATYVYDGVHEALAAIRIAFPRLPMAVLTNKPVNPSRAICSHFGLDRYFFQNYGGNSFSTKKPDSQGLLMLIAEAAALMGGTITPNETLMIGDSDVDVLTARNCGALSLGCTYGLSPHSLAASQPTLLAHDPRQWPALLASL